MRGLRLLNFDFQFFNYLFCFDGKLQKKISFLRQGRIIIIYSQIYRKKTFKSDLFDNVDAANKL